MSIHNPWIVQGWVNYNEYFRRVEMNHYEIRYYDERIVVVRIPPAAGRPVYWHLLEWHNANPAYGLIWASQTRWRARMREVLAEKLGQELADAIIDGKSKKEDKDSE